MAQTSTQRKPRKRTPRTAAPSPGLAEEERPFLHDEIVRGIPARRVKELIDRDVIPAKEVYRAIPQRTFNRRLAQGEALKPAESDAIARLLRVTDLALRTFSGERDFVRRFLSLPNPALNNRIPFDLMETEDGARQVEAILTRIAWGDYT